MNKLLLLVIASVSVFFAACSDDDEKKAPGPAKEFGYEIEVAGNLKDLPYQTYTEYNFPTRGRFEDDGRPFDRNGSLDKGRRFDRDGGPANRRCSTGDRVSLNIYQLCRQLQSEETNNNCALDDRLNEFQESCQGYAWSPEATASELANKPGLHLNCYASDPSEDGLSGKRRHPQRFENDEQFIDEASAIKYGEFIAFVFMDFRDGLYRVKIRVFNDQTGVVIGETMKTWSDQLPEEIFVENLPERMRVSCIPTIH